MTHLRLAGRSLRKAAGFTSIVSLTLAVAIGANTAMFSIYDRLVLNRVTIPDAASLVAIWFNNPQRNTQSPSISVPRFAELRRQAQSFSSIGVSAFDSLTLTGSGDPTQITALRVNTDFFPTLGIGPARGRNFTAEEDVPNGPAVCILSHELWQTRFGGRESIVGDTIQLDGAPWQVVGVMPPRVTSPFGSVQVYAPRIADVSGLTPAQIQGAATFAQAIARLKPGVTLEQARAELQSFSAGYRDRYPSRLDANNVSEPRPYVATLVGGIVPTMYTLLGAVACVLLIACANVASLFLGRLLKRRKEIAVRLSLGATRAAIVRQFLAESLIFSAAGALLGSLLAAWALAALQSILTAQLPPNTVLAINGRTLLFTALIALLSTVATGLFPALQASRPELAEHLKDSSRGTSGSQGRRLRHSLIVGEVMLSVVLLIGAALLLSSFLKLTNTAPGFEPRGAAAAFVNLPARYATAAQQMEFFDRTIDRLRAQPGVTDAAVANITPLGGGGPRTAYSVAGRPVLPLAQRPIAARNIVSEDYFRLLRIPLASGRAFTTGDRPGAPGVVILNESMAMRLFADGSPLGQTLLLGPDATTRVEVVGVIRDVKSAGLAVPAPDEMYFPLRQTPRPGMNVIARTTGEASALQATIRNAVAAADKDQAIAFFATLESNVTQSLGTQRVVAALTGAFAGLALALSLTGLYSVLAYAVSQRTPEIGIRIALGASRAQVLQLVLRDGLGLVALGLGLGLAAAAGATRLIRQLLFGVGALDPAVYAGVAAAFAIVAALACLGPSLRAARIDPLVAFRTD